MGGDAEDHASSCTSNTSHVNGKAGNLGKGVVIINRARERSLLYLRCLCPKGIWNILPKNIWSQLVVVWDFNPNTWNTEAGGSLWVQGQPGLQSEFQDSQDCYTEKPCLKRTKNKQKNLYFICMPAHNLICFTCMCTIRMPDACWGHKKELDLQTVASHHVGDKTWTQILWRSSKCS